MTEWLHREEAPPDSYSTRHFRAIEQCIATSFCSLEGAFLPGTALRWIEAIYREQQTKINKKMGWNRRLGKTKTKPRVRKFTCVNGMFDVFCQQISSKSILFALIKFFPPWNSLKGRGLAAGIPHFNVDRLASNSMASHRLIQHVGKRYGLNVSEALYDRLNV